MSLTIKRAIEKIVRERPGIGPGEIADLIGRDKSNTRAEARKLIKEGRLRAEKNGNGYALFPVNGAGHHHVQTVHVRPNATGQVIDGEFKVVSAPPSASRALVVHGAAQPADNRMAGTLAAANKARRRQGGVSLPAQYATSLNALFDADPDGADAMAGLQQEMTERMRAQTAHEEWSRQEYARRLAEEHDRVEREKKKREKKKREAEEVRGAVRRLLGVDQAEEEGTSLAEAARRAREQRRLRGEEENELRYQAGLRRQERLAAEMWAEGDEPAVERMSAEVTPPRREASREKVKPVQRKSVTEFLNQAKSRTPPPTRKSKWQQFALAGVAVAAFVCVLKFSERLAAV